MPSAQLTTAYRAMHRSIDLRQALLRTWNTNHRATVFLVEHIPDALWAARVPGYERRTVRMIAGHLHNARCMWIKMTGRALGITPPPSVSRHRVTQQQLIGALERSNERMIALFEASLGRGGVITGFSPGDVVHFATYLMVHEGHHRGQLVAVARQLDHPLPEGTTFGLWQWSKRSKE